MALETYIADSFPKGMTYNEMAQLCLRLYCTVDGIPEELHNECSKKNLAEVFARLVSRGFLTDTPLMSVRYGAHYQRHDEKGHWIEVIASIYKIGDTVDMQLGRYLIEQLTCRPT